MNTLTLHGKRYNVPSEIKELSTSQLTAMFAILYHCEQATTAKWLVLFELLSVKKWWKNIRLWFYLKFQRPTEVECYELLQLTNWFFDKPALLTRNPMPSVTIRMGWFAWETLYGPADALGNSTFREFTRALRHYCDYLTIEDSDFLDLFVACLYRPAGQNPYKHDPRAMFEDETYTAHLHIVQKMHMGQKYVTLKVFEGALTYFERAYPLVFPKNTDEEKGKTTGSQVEKMWLTINFQLSQDPTKDEATFDQPVHNILKRLDLQIEQNEKLK